MNRLWIVVSLLMVSLVFASMAWRSPVKPSVYDPNYPSECLQQTAMNVHSCTTYLLPAYFQELHLDMTVFSSEWLYAFYVEVAVSFATLALLLSLLTMKGLDFVWLARPLAPRFSKRLLLGLVVAGGLAFALFPLVSTMWNSTYEHTAFYAGLRSFLLSDGLPLGVTAAAVWCATFLVMSMRNGVLGAVKFFGLPSAFWVVSMVAAFDLGEMTNHLTQFLSVSLYGIPAISNWFVLMVASFLSIYELTYKRRGLH